MEKGVFPLSVLYFLIFPLSTWYSVVTYLLALCSLYCYWHHTELSMLVRFCISLCRKHWLRKTGSSTSIIVEAVFKNQASFYTFLSRAPRDPTSLPSVAGRCGNTFLQELRNKVHQITARKLCEYFRVVQFNVTQKITVLLCGREQEKCSIPLQDSIHYWGFRCTGETLPR